jgi:hypothetical protein
MYARCAGDSLACARYLPLTVGGLAVSHSGDI